MSPSTDPVDIRETSPRELQITWSDQHVSTFTYAWLRAVCPCAMCRSRKQKGGVEEVLATLVPPETTARDVDTVGRYALNIVFSDGHDSGIFTFDMLRELCPCAACKSPQE